MLQIMKNETEDFMALAKAYAQAERALRIERWVIVTFELRKTDGPIEILYRYDLPRTMLKTLPMGGTLAHGSFSMPFPA